MNLILLIDWTVVVCYRPYSQQRHVWFLTGMKARLCISLVCCTYISCF